MTTLEDRVTALEKRVGLFVLPYTYSWRIHNETANDGYWSENYDDLFTGVIKVGLTAGSKICAAGFRFFDVGLTDDYVIDSATLKLYASDSEGDPTGVVFTAYCEAADNPGGWNASTHRPHDCAVGVGVAQVVDAWATGERYAFDVTAAVQEVLARPGRVAGDAICIVLRDSGSTPGDILYITDFDDDTVFVAVLEVIGTPSGR